MKKDQLKKINSDELKFKGLKAEQLRWSCDAATLNMAKSEKQLEDLLDQKRVKDSFKTAIEINSPGYNIYVAGLNTANPHEIIGSLIKRFDQGDVVLEDVAYVHNFENPSMPMWIKFPAGEGKKFKGIMEQIVQELPNQVKYLFENKVYKAKEDVIKAKTDTILTALNKKIDEELVANGFELMQYQTQMGPAYDLGYIVDGRPISLNDLPMVAPKVGIAAEQVEQIKKSAKEVQKKVMVLQKEIQEVMLRDGLTIRDLKKAEVDYALNGMFSFLLFTHAGNTRLEKFLINVKSDILKNWENIGEKNGRGVDLGGMMMQMPQMHQPKPESRYEVNLVVDHSNTKGANIVFEPNPTYLNLDGMVERSIGGMGEFIIADYTSIRAGTIAQANGGYLVLNAFDLLRTSADSWMLLKRVLKTGELSIEDLANVYGIMSKAGIKPEPLPVKFKVVLIGDHEVYHILNEREEDFKKLFKVKAEFDFELENTKENQQNYTSLLVALAEEIGLSLNADAAAAIMEHSTRLSGSQKKLSADLMELTDVLTEAANIARRNSTQDITKDCIKKAIDERRHRVNLIEEKLSEYVREEKKKIETKGEVVGQINALSVLQLSDGYMFGGPLRMTANAYKGQSGIRNIESIVGISGPINRKAIEIISGYVGENFGQDKELGKATISIAFEQLYGGIEGDSASLAELYVTLSALSGLPLKQEGFITGSVDQKGNVQPIGGVNEKIEAAFQTCLEKGGLSGENFVVIPHQNINELALKDELIKAVSEGKFHIYPIKTAKEGFEIFTGVASGEVKDGKFEEGTGYARVNAGIKNLIYGKSKQSFPFSLF